MASDRRQIAVRMDDSTCVLWDKLHEVSAAKVGVSLTQPQVFALALAALAEKWQVAADAPPAAPDPAQPARGKRRHQSD
jgi:hypothetical protein